MTRQVILTERVWCQPAFGRSLHTYINPRQVTFHTFSQESEEVEGGSLHYPVAIVEFTDGTVQTVSLDRIRFINPI
jgi:hypothetical protein